MRVIMFGLTFLKQKMNKRKILIIILLILLVACLKNDLSTSLDSIPSPLSVILICFLPPSTISTIILVEPASTEFSINSLTKSSVISSSNLGPL